MAIIISFAHNSATRTAHLCSVWHQLEQLNLRPESLPPRWLALLAGKLMLAVSWELSQCWGLGGLAHLHIISPQAAWASSQHGDWISMSPENQKGAVLPFMAQSQKLYSVFVLKSQSSLPGFKGRAHRLLSLCWRNVKVTVQGVHMGQKILE